MTSPVPDADAAEQHVSTDGAAPAELPRDLPEDAPVADAVEQALPAAPAGGPVPAEVPLEADPADAAEQAHVVPLDEEEQRG